MKRNHNQLFKLLLIVVSLLSITVYVIQLNGEDDYLIVSIIDAEIPPRAGIRDYREDTIYTVDLVYQVENPTESNIPLDYNCGPYPFPRLKTKLKNESIVVQQGVIIEWVNGFKSLEPGIFNDTFHFAIIVENYKEESLPEGEYILWFDYTNCSIVSVPVITEKLTITVTSNNISYYFDYNDRLEIYIFNANSIQLLELFAVITILTIFRKKRRDLRSSKRKL